MAWPAIVAAGIAATSKLLGAAGDQYSSSKAYRRSVNSAQHAHQWEVGDLRAAGLNPILSANGQGAAAQSFQAAPMDLDFSGAFTKGAQAELAQANAKLADAEVEKTKAETTNNLATAAKQMHEIDEIKERIRNLAAERNYKDTAAWLNVGNALEILPRILQMGSTRQMQQAQSGMFAAYAAKARNEGLISAEELAAIRSDPEAYKEKVFGLDPYSRSVRYQGRDMYRRVEKRRNDRIQNVRKTKGHPSAGGKVGGW